MYFLSRLQTTTAVRSWLLHYKTPSRALRTRATVHEGNDQGLGSVLIDQAIAPTVENVSGNTDLANTGSAQESETGTTTGTARGNITKSARGIKSGSAWIEKGSVNQATGLEAVIRKWRGSGSGWMAKKLVQCFDSKFLISRKRS